MPEVEHEEGKDRRKENLLRVGVDVRFINCASWESQRNVQGENPGVGGRNPREIIHTEPKINEWIGSMEPYGTG